MKNQYFGDNRDLFKYDLILQIIKAGLVTHFTFIPMLTPDVPSNKSVKREGEQRNRSKAKAGNKNSDLVTFLNKFADRSKRDIKELQGFFKKQGIEAIIFGDYFYHAKRETYFREAEKKLLPKSLIFVDPDKGLEIKRTRDEHIKYCEIKSLYDRMDKSSILMIFQYFPRIRTQSNIQKHFYERSTKLKEIGGGLPIDYIEDTEIKLFFLTRDKSLRESLGKVISKYGETYQLRVGLR